MRRLQSYALTFVTLVGIGLFITIANPSSASAADDSTAAPSPPPPPPSPPAEISTEAGTPSSGGSGGGTVSKCKFTVFDPSLDTADVTEHYSEVAIDALGEATGASVPDDGIEAVDEDGNWSWKTTIDGVEYRFMRRACDGDVALIWVPVITPEALIPGLYEKVKKLLPDPQAAFAPIDSEGRWLYVQVPTDFRVTDASQWEPITARAEAGPVWASVTATPTKLVFNPGDPTNPAGASCDGSGPVDAYDPASPGRCSYTYLNASSIASGNVFHYEIRTVWTITTDSSSGPIKPPSTLETASSGSIPVAEARASVVD